MLRSHSYEEEVKCGGCNWGAHSFYSVADEDIKNPFELDEDGRPALACCAYCILELIEDQFEVTLRPTGGGDGEGDAEEPGQP